MGEFEDGRISEWQLTIQPEFRNLLFPFWKNASATLPLFSFIPTAFAN